MKGSKTWKPLRLKRRWKKKLTMGTKQKQRHNGLRGKTRGFGIGFPFDTERKHTECKDAGDGRCKGRNLGKEMPMTHSSNK